MPRPNAAALERSLSMMLVGVTKQREADEVEAAPLRLDETDQVFQVAVEGEAGAAIGTWAPFTVDFDYMFVYAPTQRMVQYDRPQFTWGFELRSSTPVLVYCQLTGWATQDTDPEIDATITTTGAELVVGAFSPGLEDGDDPIPYRGLLHLNFGGFAAPYDTPSDDEAI